MTKHLTTTAIALALGLGVATTASAEEKRFYGAFNYGQISADDLKVYESSVDLDADAFAFTGGYQINKYVSGEFTFTWHEFDDETDSRTIDQGVLNFFNVPTEQTLIGERVNATLEGNGFSLEAVAVATPIQYRVRPIAMLGVIYRHIDGDLTFNAVDSASGAQLMLSDGSAARTTQSGTEDDFDVVWGVGIDADITDSIGIRATYKGTGSSADMSGWFIGPTIRF